MKFKALEPIIVYTTNGGNGIYIEPIRGKLLLQIGKEWGLPINTTEELTEFLIEHFRSLGSNRAT